jgi:hypothetical protein
VNTERRAAATVSCCDVGVGDDQPHTREAPLPEAAQELPPEGLTLAVAHLQAQQFAAAVGIDAHGHVKE